MKSTVPPVAVTVNPIPSVEPFMSGVDVSVHVVLVPVLFQADITVPNLIAPPDSVTT